MKYPFDTCDVFTDRHFGGNRLVVLPNPGELSDAKMQRPGILDARNQNKSGTRQIYGLPPIAGW